MDKETDKNVRKTGIIIAWMIIVAIGLGTVYWILRILKAIAGLFS